MTTLRQQKHHPAWRERILRWVPAVARSIPLEPRFHTGIQCHLLGMYHLPNCPEAAIHIPAGEVADKTGAIRMATSIDRRIKRILIIAGESPDICYVKSEAEGSSWESYDLR